MEKEKYEGFSSLINTVHGSMQKIKNRYSGYLDLKPVHILWIYLLNKYPEGLTANELAQKSKSDKSLVSREIRSLIDEEIVYVREESGKRRYNDKFKLTPVGVKKAEIILNVVKMIQENVLEEVSEEDLLVFVSVLKHLSNQFETLLNDNDFQERIKNECQNY